MTDKVANAYTNFQVFPKYVTDETLKRARTEDKDGNPAINIYNKELGDIVSEDSQGNKFLRVDLDSSDVPDLTKIEQRIGAKNEAKWNDSVDTNEGSVISVLKSISLKFK